MHEGQTEQILGGTRCLIAEQDDVRAASALRALTQAGVTAVRVATAPALRQALLADDWDAAWLGLRSPLGSALLEPIRGDPAATDDRLTRFVRDLGFSNRQREVFAPFATGIAPKEIAVRLGLSDSTIRFHLRALYRKIGVRNQREALARLVSVAESEEAARDY